MLKQSIKLIGMTSILIFVLSDNVNATEPKLMGKDFKSVKGRTVASSPGETAVLLNPNGKYDFSAPSASEFQLGSEHEDGYKSANSLEGKTFQLKVFEK